MVADKTRKLFSAPFLSLSSLRLSRAERKYGVQGDRANQELTPLPMAIEDVNSDEDDEDHTLFEVNRQSIRILWNPRRQARSLARKLAFSSVAQCNDYNCNFVCNLSL